MLKVLLVCFIFWADGPGEVQGPGRSGDTWDGMTEPGRPLRCETCCYWWVDEETGLIVDEACWDVGCG